MGHSLRIHFLREAGDQSKHLLVSHVCLLLQYVVVVWKQAHRSFDRASGSCDVDHAPPPSESEACDRGRPATSWPASRLWPYKSARIACPCFGSRSLANSC